MITSPITAISSAWKETGKLSEKRICEDGGNSSSPSQRIICILYFWKFVGYYIFIYSSRLQMIPKEYYEYASLHGAGKWQSFYYITCPILFPVILFTLILSIMSAFKCYREAFLLGGTHPDNSIYFLQHFMNNNLQNLNYQKVSASATIITVFILFLSGLIYMIYYFLKRRTADA